MSLKVGIVGAAGYAGAELIRLVLGHPEFELAAITSNADAGQPLSAVYPSFAGVSDLVFTTHDAPELTSCDAVFLAVPHTAAMAQVPRPACRRRFLLRPVCRLPPERSGRVRGVVCRRAHEPRAAQDPRFWPGPSCSARTWRPLHPTTPMASPYWLPAPVAIPPQRALLPRLRACGLGGRERPVVVDAISGVTGAGKSCNARTHFCSADENLEAYGVGKHRHTPEIEQILGLADRIVFTPHLAPLKRGLLSTVTLPLAPQALDTLTLEDVVDLTSSSTPAALLCACSMPASSQDGLGRRHQCRPDWPRAQQARGRSGGYGRHRQSVQGRSRPGGPVRQHRLWL